MPGVLAPVTYEPMKAVWTTAGNGSVPVMKRWPEAATQTYQLGVPLMLDGSGNVVEFSATGANIVLGVSYEQAHNLSTAATAQNLSEGAPVNQPSAVTIPVGARIRDGFCGIYEANSQSVFSIVLKAGQVFAQTLMIAGTAYGITKDATTGLWFLDNTVTTGNSAVVEIVGNDPSAPNTAAGGARVFVQFIAAKRYFQ